jgi:hypothetical protein
MIDADKARSTASPAETREWLLTKSNRPFIPIRRTFIQRPPGQVPRHGPLLEFVTRRNIRALLAYLMIVAGISAEQASGWTLTLPSGAWARLMDTTKTASQESALTAVSKTLTWLEQRHLITRERVGRSRQIRVTLLREDGSGEPYTRPGLGNRDPYIKLPHEFWLDGWSDRLKLPAIAMLLVASAEKSDFPLATERLPDWYGWSADTAEDGFRQLRDTGLIVVKQEVIKAPETHQGWTLINKYRLKLPFQHRLQPAKSAAKKTRKKIAKKATKKSNKTTAEAGVMSAAQSPRPRRLRSVKPSPLPETG